VTDALLSTQRLRKAYGALAVTDDVSISVGRNEFKAVIGPNGAGKSTFINQVGGQLSSDSGAVIFEGRDITGLTAAQRSGVGIARVFQVPRLFSSFRVRDNPAAAVLGRRSHGFKFWRPLESMDDVLSEAQQALAAVGLSDQVNRPSSLLSHGDRRLLEIAIALASRPKLLLLDEPMAGLGRDESTRMTELLLRSKGTMTVLMVEHDMEAVFALADTVMVLSCGRVIADGPPQMVREDSAVRASYLGSHDDD
jgi:branched-chain amino acid transport system ATP-binding protein